MTVAEMQAFLARLYTQDTFRRLFELAPDQSLDEYGLEPDERAAIKGIDRDMLERFALQLRTKRRGKLVSAYPLLFRAGGEALERYVSRFFALQPARPHEPPLDGVMAFGTFMEATISADTALPPYLADVARYERLRASAVARPPTPLPAGDQPRIDVEARPFLLPGVELGVFSHDIPRLASGFYEGSIPSTLTHGEFSYIFQPAPDSPQPRVFAVNGATSLLLSHCDGSKTVSELARVMDGEPAASNMVDEVIEILEHLAAIGVVGMAEEQRAH